MRRGLIWALGATAVLSIGSLWTAKTPGIVSAIAPRVREHQDALEQIGQSSAKPAERWTPLPASLARLEIEPSKRDIFAPVMPPPPPPVKPAPPVQVVVAPPAPPPQAPAPDVRFLGKMVSPDGNPLVYLTQGNNPVAVTAGQKLDNGYLVESITSDAVTLLYPLLDQRVRLEVPPAPAP